jgi:phosphoenolpyruvate carboxykinase (ATP)
MVRRRRDVVQRRRKSVTDRVPHSGLEAQGIATGAEIFWNLSTAPLVEHAVRRGEGLLA